MCVKKVRFTIVKTAPFLPRFCDNHIFTGMLNYLMLPDIISLSGVEKGTKQFIDNIQSITHRFGKRDYDGLIFDGILHMIARLTNLRSVSFNLSDILDSYVSIGVLDRDFNRLLTRLRENPSIIDIELTFEDYLLDINNAQIIISNDTFKRVKLIGFELTQYAHMLLISAKNEDIFDISDCFFNIG